MGAGSAQVGSGRVFVVQRASFSREKHVYIKNKCSGNGVHRSIKALTKPLTVPGCAVLEAEADPAFDPDPEGLIFAHVIALGLWLC